MRRGDRRHTRRLRDRDDAEAVRTGARDMSRSAEDLQRKLRREARKRAREARRELERAERGPRAAASQAAAAAQAGSTAAVRGARAFTQHGRSLISNRELSMARQRVLAPGRRRPHAQQPADRVPEGARDAAVAGVAVGVVLVAAAAFARARGGGGGDWFENPFAGRGGRSGKWVRDRSLGGRLVEVRGRGGRRAGPGAYNPLAGLEGDEASAGARRGGAPPRGAEAATPMPAWWDPPAPAGVPDAVRERARAEAQALMRRMEAEKVTAGKDIPLDGLVEVKRLCVEGGCSVAAATAASRDSMFRQVAEEAVGAAAAGSSARLGGERPARMVGAMAGALGVSDADARRMSVAIVAKKARDLLVSACAEHRSGDAAALLGTAAAVSGVLRTFPLGRGSAEAEMVAAGIKSLAGREERESVLAAVEEACGGDPELAGTVREMLDLVGPAWTPALGPD